jgi:hypothetical protein
VESYCQRQRDFNGDLIKEQFSGNYQLFIDEPSSSRATEQIRLIAKVNKINPLVKMVGATSGLMILAIAGSGCLPWIELSTAVNPRA